MSVQAARAPHSTIPTGERGKSPGRTKPVRECGAHPASAQSPKKPLLHHQLDHVGGAFVACELDRLDGGGNRGVHIDGIAGGGAGAGVDN